MKLNEKIAMVWTAPIVIAFSLTLALLALILTFVAKILTWSGTFGASIYLFDAMKLKLIDRRLRKLVKQDEKMHKFES